MKRQTIYSMLIVVLAAVSAAHAQTGEGHVSEARMRRLLSGDGTENTEIKFNASAVNRVRTLSINPNREISPNSPQELRALIFENYTPPGPKGGAVLKATEATRVSRGSGAEKLPSESAAETTKTMETEASPAQTPPTQGDVKEEQ